MNIKETYLDLDTYKTRILECGEGPPTICLHGVHFSNGADLWRQPMRAGLAKGRRIIAVDNLGWGPSPRPSWDVQFSFFSDHLRQIQDALGLKSTNLIGHSFGGWIAALLAYESPDRVQKLVLSDSGGMSPTAPENVSRFEPPSEDELRRYLADIYLDKDDAEEQYKYHWRNATTTGAVDYYRRMGKILQDPVSRRHYHVARRLPHILAPTLVIFGEDAPMPFSAAVGRQMADAMPNSRFVSIEGAGHLTPYQKTSEYVREVTAFLEE